MQHERTTVWVLISSVLFLGSFGANAGSAAKVEAVEPRLPSPAETVPPDSAQLDLTPPTADTAPVAVTFSPERHFPSPVPQPPDARELIAEPVSPFPAENESLPASHPAPTVEPFVPLPLRLPETTPTTEDGTNLENIPAGHVTLAPAGPADVEVKAAAVLSQSEEAPTAPVDYGTLDADTASTAKPEEQFSISVSPHIVSPHIEEQAPPALSPFNEDTSRFVSPELPGIEAMSQPQIWTPGTMPDDALTNPATLELEAQPVQVAQLTPDNTLGAESSIVNSNGVVNGQTVNLIEGGATRGSNLFHSFESFDVFSTSVYFANPVDIENIFARVTGNETSRIFGLLGVNGPANLFLLNPNGIIFDSGARLDIRGSFTASTGSRFTFANGSEFNAAPALGESLTISVPLGVQFNEANGPFNGEISSFGRPPLSAGQDLALLGNTLDLSGQFSAGNDLTLAGNTLTLAGQFEAENDLTLQATGTVTLNGTTTAPFTANAGNDLTVQGNQGITLFTIQSPDQVPLISGGDMTLISDGAIAGDTAFFNSGGNLQFLRLDGTPVDLTDFNAPVIYAVGDVVFGDYTGTALKVEATGSIQAGDIVIIAPNTRFTADGSGTDEDLLASSRAVILRAGVPRVDNPNVPQVAGGTTFENGVITNQPPGMVLPPGSILFDSIITRNVTGGDAGPIILEAAGSIINTGFSNLFDGVALAADTISRDGKTGNGGNISLSAGRGATGQGDIILNYRVLSGSQSFGGNAGNGGSVSFVTRQGDIQLNNAGVFADSSSDDFQGGSAQAGGAISFSTTGGDIRLTNSSLSSEAEAFDAGQQANTGPAGNVSLTTRTGNITLQNSSVFAMNDAPNQSGPGGAVTIASSDGGDITLNNLSRIWSYSASRLGQAGDGGAVRLSTTTGNISLSDSSFIDTSSRSSESNAGNGGAISLSTTTGNITLTENSSLGSSSFSSSLVEARNADDGGDITITSDTGNIALTGGIVENSSVRSQSFTRLGNAGNGGAISFKTRTGNIDLTSLDLSAASFVGGSIFAANSEIIGTAGNGGSISVTTTEGNIRGSNARLLTYAVTLAPESPTSGRGGDVFLQAQEELSGLQIFTLSSNGVSGNAFIQGQGNLQVENVNLTASGRVEIPDPFSPGNSIVLVTTGFGPSGSTTVSSSGNLVLDNTQVLSDANGGQSAGNITVTSPIAVTLTNGSIINSNTNSMGAGGNIRFDTPQISLDANSRITANAAATSSNTRGGSITFNAPSSLLLQGAGEISVNTASSSRAGNLTLNAPQVVVDGLTLSASTSSAGAGGDVSIRTSRLTFANGGQIAASTSGPGPGGNLTVTGNSPLTLQGNGRLTVASEGANSGRAGDLNVNASTLALRDGVELSVNSASRAGGGNINIAVDRNMVMSGNSYINATSTNPNAGDGGNVNIALDDGFLVGVPGQDNDIIANANGGNGGNINVRALRVYGFSQQDEADVARLRGNGTNDISASSNVGLPGAIALDTLELDPSQGLVELPVDLTDRANQVTPGCGLGNADDGSEFVATGRGGLPPGPSDPIAPNSVAVPWVVPDEGAPVAQVFEPATAAAPLVEAQGIALDEQGNAYFVAEVGHGEGADGAAIAAQPCAISAHP